MLPGFLKPSYRQYKDDTDRFVTWLVNIAEKKCGLQPQMASADGKGQKYVATVNQLLKFGKAVAKSSVHVPLSILARAKRAVELRKDVTAYHVGTKQGSDRGHCHFNRILEEICTILEPKSWTTPGEDMNEETADGAKKPMPSSVTDENEEDKTAGSALAIMFMNRFAALDVEDPEETPEDAKGFIAVEVVDRNKNEKVKAGSEDYLSDDWFKFQCLFNDLNKWRSFISQTWTEYRDQKIDLMTASAVTDSALQLARDLVQEALQGWPEHLSDAQSPMALQDTAYMVACVERGLQPAPIQDFYHSNEEMAKVIDWFFLGPVAMLRGLREVIQPGSIPIYKKGHFGTYDVKADRANMSFRERTKEDTLLLGELIPEFSAIAIIKKGLPMLPINDEITNGFVEFWRTKKPSVWLSFATQILLDVHHVMRTSRMSAWDDLRMCGKRNGNIIDDFFKLSKTHPKPSFWPEEADQEINNIRRIIQDFIEGDGIASMRQGIVRKVDGYPDKHAVPDMQGIPDHFLFKRNPVLCGLLMMHINMRMQRMGQHLASQWWDIQQLAFLYNLVQRSPGPGLTWPDMELFIKIHGEELVFVGERPRDALQSLNRLELATGISTATRFARNSRQPGLRSEFHPPGTDGKNGRRLEPTNKVGNLFRVRYAEGQNTRIICSANVEMLLNELSEELVEEATKTKEPAEKTKKKTGRRGQTNSRARVGRKWVTKHEIGPLQLLAVLKTKLCQEEPILMFNYFGMHQRCFELLRLIRKKEDAKFRQYFTDAYMPDESLLSNIVILVHHVARSSTIVDQQTGRNKAKGNGGITSRLVLSCGEVMRNYLRTKGNAACKELEIFCKNKGQVQALVTGGDVDDEVDDASVSWVNLEDFLGPAAIASLMTGIPMGQTWVAPADVKIKTVPNSKK